MLDLLRLLLIAFALLVVTDTAAVAQDVGQYVEREEDSAVVLVGDQDELMNAAIEEANETIGVFFTSMDSGKYPRESFWLKIMTETAPDEYEHMWYMFVDYTDEGHIRGLLVHNPYASGSHYEAGGVYELSPQMVTDWRFEDGGKLRGDFTTRVILGRMVEEQPQNAAEILVDYHDDPLPQN